MKARCVRLLGSDGKPQDKSPWITVGSTYDILEVLWVRDRGWLLRLVGDGENGVALFQLEMFDIVDRQIPSNWVATWHDEAFFSLCPEPWSRPGFWERYYDHDPDAIQTFKEEMRCTVNSR
jgi:hypothetical protein